MFRSLRSKLDNKARLKQACSTAVSDLQTTLRIVDQATGDAGLPRLHTAIDDLLFVLDVIKKTSHNAEDFEKLSDQIVGLNRLLETSKSQGAISSVAISQIDRLFITSTTSLEELRNMAPRNALTRLIHQVDDARSISSHIRTVTWSIQSFTVETTLAIEFGLDGRATWIREGINNLRETTTNEFQQPKAKLDMKDGHPPYAIDSSFDRKNRTGCLEGTRTDILDRIFDWIGFDDPSAQDARALKSKRRAADTVAANISIFWINGSVGTGKTTIAYTVAKACRERGVLGASFFCSRDDAECSNPHLIFTSIAYQLGNSSELFKAEVTRVMKSNPDIGYASPSYQLEELIVKPLRTLGSSFSPCVIVVDALDECKDTGTTSAILSSLSLHVSELLPLKILMTSRPETHITTIFQSSDLGPVTRRYILHEVELGVVQSDIERYLSTKLASMRVMYHIKDEWPTAEDIHSLTLLSSGLFIYASTSVRFVEDGNYSNPRRQLTRLLCNAPTATEPASPEYSLDRLYSQVLNHAFPAMSSELSGRLKTVLGTIVFLRDPLASVDIERLLGVQPGAVQETLCHLHSVIMVPYDDNQVIRTIHPSFFDFISNSARCQNPKILINSGVQHTLLARACLDVMKGLKRDMCKIRNPSMLNNEVDDLPARIMTCIPPELQYACRHWAWHLSNAMFSDILVDLLKEFCSKYLLFWIEVLGLMGDLRNGLLALDAAQQVIGKVGRDVTDSKILLRDCERFTLEFFTMISTCSLQVYHSALLFTPEDTLIKKTYRRELDIPIKVYNELDEQWDSCIRTIEGHSNLVKSIAFSPDGTRIVSGSSDLTVLLWDAVSGAHLNTFHGHSDAVKSVTFSPDGMRIVSGSSDCTIRLWDAVSGEHLNTFKGHSELVNSVAFSPDGMHIVSGSFDFTLRLWAAVSGAHLNTFKGHSSLVTSVGFSPDGTRIISGSFDKTIRLWDVASGAHLKTFKGHSDTVNSVTFSPDGAHIVSGSDDRTIRLWDALSGAHLKSLKGHSELVNSVAFSPDGTRIVSGSLDFTLRLWDAARGAHMNTLEGHSDSVNSVSFSPDGTRIISGSSDKTVRLWDAASSPHLNTFKGPFGHVRSLAFSPNGTRVISESYGKPLRVWDAATGAHWNPLTGGSVFVNSVAFSPDGTRFVCGFSDRTVRLWDAVGGTHPITFSGHTGSVRSVAFLPDGTRVVSGSDDRTVRLWDGVSGAPLKTLRGHSGSVRSVAFSPDGTCVVSGSDDRTVRMWDAVGGTHLITFNGHSRPVISVAFLPDGTRVVSGSHDQTVRLWNAVNGGRLITFGGHWSTVESVAFSLDGTRIVSGSDDNTLQLWDAVRGALLNTFQGHFTNVDSIARSCNLSGDSLSTDGVNPSSPIFSYIATDGWVHSLAWNRRICWVPVSCRPCMLAAGGSRVAFGTEDGRVIILDFEGMDTYFRNL